MNQPSGSCYRDFFSETLIASTGSSLPVPDVATTKYGAEQRDIPTTANVEDDFEMDHEPANPTNLAEPDPFVPGGHSRSNRFIEVYEGCVERFPGGKTFMDEFRNDRYAEERQQNLYFPWASRREWSFASWLLRSRLSMKSIDSLLSLELVSDLCYILCSIQSCFSVERLSIVFLFCERIACSCRNAPFWPPMVM